MYKVIFLNGPPRCGKDTICKHLNEKYPAAFDELRMSRALKRGIHTMLGMDDVSSERFDTTKDKSCPEFFGARPRDIYIAGAEQFFKKYFNQEVFGHIWLRQYYELGLDETIVVVPDTGFYDETLPITQSIGRDKCILIRIFRDGCDYSYDSRGYVKDICDTEFDIYNKDGRLDATYSWVRLELERLGVFAQVAEKL